MHPSFREGFEKRAFIGKALYNLGRRGANSIMGAVKNVTPKIGKSAVKDPLKAGGTALGVGFGVMEGANVISKTKNFMKPTSKSLKSPSFYSRK